MTPSQVINYILEKEIVKAATFAKAIGVNPTQIYDLISGKTKSITDSIAGKILSVYPNYNRIWLLTGEGEMLVNTNSNTMTQVFTPKATEMLIQNEVVNLYDIEASANLKTLFTNKDQNILGQISIPNIPKCDGAVYVKGDSMYPLLKSGDIVAYKEIPLDVQHIFYGEMYLVSIDLDGDEYLAVKYVQHSDLGPEWIKLVSYNPHHEPKDFPLSSVRAMALVKLSIRMNTMK